MKSEGPLAPLLMIKKPRWVNATRRLGSQYRGGGPPFFAKQPHAKYCETL